MTKQDSRIPGFYRLPLATRRDELRARGQLTDDFYDDCCPQVEDIVESVKRLSSW